MPEVPIEKAGNFTELSWVILEAPSSEIGEVPIPAAAAACPVYAAAENIDPGGG